MEKRYFLTKKSNRFDSIPNVRIFFDFNSWAVISIDSSFYVMFVELGLKFIELSKEQILGFKLFGECRLETKIAYDDEEEIEYLPASEETAKVKIPVSPERFEMILNSMKLFASVLFEEEFDKRLEKLNLSYSTVERETWQRQYEDALKYKENKIATSFLTLLAQAKSLTVNELADKILSAKKSYDNQVQELYTKLSQLKEEFKSKNSVIELNLLYSKYFGMTCSYEKEYCDAHPEIFDSQGSVIGQKPLGYYF